MDDSAASDAGLARSIEADAPGCPAAVGRDCTVTWAGAGGVGDMSAGEGPTTDSVFDLAPVSKQFTGDAILVLKQDRAFSLDDPLLMYVPGLGPDADRVTIA